MRTRIGANNQLVHTEAQPVQDLINKGSLQVIWNSALAKTQVKKRSPEVQSALRIAQVFRNRSTSYGKFTVEKELSLQQLPPMG